MNTEKAMLAIMLIASPRYITEAHLRRAVGAWRSKQSVLDQLVAKGLVSVARVFAGDSLPKVVGYTLTHDGATHARKVLFEGVKLW